MFPNEIMLNLLQCVLRFWLNALFIMSSLLIYKLSLLLSLSRAISIHVFNFKCLCMFLCSFNPLLQSFPYIVYTYIYFFQTFRIKPPMCITKTDVKFAVDVLSRAISEFLKNHETN